MSRATLTQTLRPTDAVGRHWLKQVTIRLRREVGWLRFLQGELGITTQGDERDRVQEGLDLSRYSDRKREFLAKDATARFLSDELKEPEPDGDPAVRGSFSWVCRDLDLNDTARFVVALGLATTYDNAVGPVIAYCLGEANAVRPTMGLAQRLWDRPDEVLEVAVPGSPIFDYGLIQRSDQRLGIADVDWDRSFSCPHSVARLLLNPDGRPPPGLVPLEPNGAPLEEIGNGSVVSDLLRHETERRVRVVPIIGPEGADHPGTAAEVGRAAGRRVLSLALDPSVLVDGGTVNAMVTCSWLMDAALFLDLDSSIRLLSRDDENRAVPGLGFGPAVTILASTESPSDLTAVPKGRWLPAITTADLDYEGRLELWRKGLGSRNSTRLGGALTQSARRYRFERATIASLTRRLKVLGRYPTGADVEAACRAELRLQLGDLAEEIKPRFEPDELILRHSQKRQLAEIRSAMETIAEVHHRWGTARAWNSAGISAMFHGPPGTGKTMAAETLAKSLDLPLYRVDLSQVVDKYVGQTEKNLRRVFDALAVADAVLFFDEADTLFAPRTKVKDSHDRYANLEVGYLLGRMENAKGLVILATNRRQDLDQAFVRRLRHIIAFDRPSPAERRRIWDVVIPKDVDRGSLDLDLLADYFDLTGGQIRSAVFAASLQSASRRPGKKPFLDVDTVMVAIKREFDKEGRSVPAEQFGAYTDLIRSLDRGGEPT